MFVLVVDDEFLIRWAIARTLSDAGHRVAEAADGAAAIQLLSEGAVPDVVLLDCRLPDTHGLSLLAWIRRLCPGTAVVMMTADASPETVVRAKALGAQGVMLKPFDMGGVADALTHARDAQSPAAPPPAA